MQNSYTFFPCTRSWKFYPWKSTEWRWFRKQMLPLCFSFYHWLFAELKQCNYVAMGHSSSGITKCLFLCPGPFFSPNLHTCESVRWKPFNSANSATGGSWGGAGSTHNVLPCSVFIQMPTWEWNLTSSNATKSKTRECHVLVLLDQT